MKTKTKTTALLLLALMLLPLGGCRGLRGLAPDADEGEPPGEVIRTEIPQQGK